MVPEVSVVDIRYLHMTHNPLRCWGVTSRRNVWYHDKSSQNQLLMLKNALEFTKIMIGAICTSL